MTQSITRAAIGHPPYTVSCVLRVLILWTAIRGATRLAGGVIEGPVASLVFAGIVCAVVLLDARATRELVYMRNLGLPARWLAALSIVTVLALEIVFHVMT